MGMRIGGGNYSAAEQMQWQQGRQNFAALSSAISGGKLSDAQAAFSKIANQITNSGKTIDPNSFLGKIGAALQSGDLGTAQQLLASRQNGQSGNAASAGSSSASSAANTAAAAGGASASGAVQGRHHHHGGLALELSKAIQSGDTNTAQSSMQKIVADLQQLSSMANPSGSASAGSGYNSSTASAASAAAALLKNPDFQALQAAVAKGDAAGMKSAWNNLIGGASSATSGSTAAASSSAAQQPVAA